MKKILKQAMITRECKCIYQQHGMYIEISVIEHSTDINQISIGLEVYG
jgi:hypothetical protein